MARGAPLLGAGAVEASACVPCVPGTYSNSSGACRGPLADIVTRVCERVMRRACSAQWVGSGERQVSLIRCSGYGKSVSKQGMRLH